MSNITNTDTTIVEELFADEDLRFEYLNGLDSAAEATAEDADDATVSYNADDIFFRGTNESDTYYGGNGDDDIFGGNGDDIIFGMYGFDDIFGGAGNDNIRGGIGDDELYGGTGNDTLDGEWDDDTIDGGTGIDTSVYSTDAGAATITNNNDDTFTVVTATGTDTITNVERLQFGDYNIALDIDGTAGDVAEIIGSVLGTSELTNKELVGIGIDYLDNGGTYESLVEAALVYVGADTDEEIVNTLYTNIINAAPDQEHTDFYLSLVDNTDMTITDLAVLASQSSVNGTNVDLVGLTATGIEYDVVA